MDNEWTIQVDGEHGWFEHSSGFCSGGLWFDGVELIDYDGCYELHRNVIKKLRDMGYVVSSEFE